MDMTEQVARALCMADGHPEDLQFEGQPIWASYSDTARVAIKAMREATTAMIDCGVAFALKAGDQGFPGWSKYIAEKHRVMIDAALTPAL